MAVKGVLFVPSCSGCVYSRPNNETSVACHRYPPTVTRAEGLEVTCHFPLIGKSAWCGEFRVRKEEPRRQK